MKEFFDKTEVPMENTFVLVDRVNAKAVMKKTEMYNQQNKTDAKAVTPGQATSQNIKGVIILDTPSNKPDILQSPTLLGVENSLNNIMLKICYNLDPQERYQNFE